MYIIKRSIGLLITCCFLLAAPTAAQTLSGTPTAATLQLIERANDYWQEHNKPECRGFWDNAVYFTGNMEVYKLLGRARDLTYSERFCDHNKWMGATGTNRHEWQYKTYGEDNDHVLFADWQACFQTYIDLYMTNPADYKVARAKEVMGHMAHRDDCDYWWWSDALYMAMPTMSKMYKLTGERMYLDRMTEIFRHTDSLLYDAEAQLYYRDAKYIYPKVKNRKGGKTFWARGNGWVLAGLAKVLADLPHDYEYRPLYEQRFRELAAGVARSQQKKGYWSRSLLCEKDAPGPETSGTALFTYGMLWGVNHGLLERPAYEPVLQKAWDYLSTVALQADGSIGYVQPVGEKPDPDKKVGADSQTPFGTGAWLLAACEMVRYQDASTSAKNSPTVTIEIKNPTGRNRGEVIELDAAQLFGRLGISGGRQFVVRDNSNFEVPYQLTHDGKVLIQVFVRPQSAATLKVRKGIPGTFINYAYGRVYPDRYDDLGWENDRNGWRAYGPAFERSKQQAYGYDAFVKNGPMPIMESLYNSEFTSYDINARLRKAGRSNETDSVHRAMSYHFDHGRGMDAYTVGPTLGAGTAALMNGDNFLYPWAWKTCDILDNGPLRFTAKLTYGPIKTTGDKTVTETRLLSLDKGTHLNKVQVSYDGLKDNCPMGAGIVVHKSDPEAYAMNAQEGYVAYADATDRPNAQSGQLFVGCVFTEGVTATRYIPLVKEAAGGIGHVVGLADYQPGGTFTYYFGTAWSKYDMPTLQDWQNTLVRYRKNLQEPLQVVIK